MLKKTTNNEILERCQNVQKKKINNSPTFFNSTIYENM